MSNVPEQPESPEPSKWFRWLLVLNFWLLIAPMIFLAGSRITATPLGLFVGKLAERGHLAESTALTAIAVLNAAGFIVGGALVWLVWRQARGYFERRAA